MGWRTVRAEARGLRSILSEMGNLKGIYKAVQESNLRAYRSLWLLGSCEGSHRGRAAGRGLHSPGLQVCTVGRSSWILRHPAGTRQDWLPHWVRVAGRGQG